MCFVDEYCVLEQVMQLIEYLCECVLYFFYIVECFLWIMEVCGGYIYVIFKFGFDQLLLENVEFIYGLGCLVCVLLMGRIDICVEIVSYSEVIFCIFGDVMCVLGKQGLLLQVKVCGVDVCIVYLLMDVLKLVQENLICKVVFFGLGFEIIMLIIVIIL